MGRKYRSSVLLCIVSLLLFVAFSVSAFALNENANNGEMAGLSDRSADSKMLQGADSDGLGGMLDRAKDTVDSAVKQGRDALDSAVDDMSGNVTDKSTDAPQNGTNSGTSEDAASRVIGVVVAVIIAVLIIVFIIALMAKKDNRRR